MGPAVRPGRRIEKKGKDRTGQNSQKKSQGGNNSPIWGEAPTVPIETKICMAGNLADIIMCGKFQGDIFRGYDFTGGQISHLPIDFCMGLTTVQRDCAACDKHISEKVNKAYMMLRIIKRNFEYISKNCFLMLYKSLVRSHLEYANSVWYPKRLIDVDKLERVQKRATKLIP